VAAAARDRPARTLRGDAQTAFSVELTARTDGYLRRHRTPVSEIFTAIVTGLLTIQGPPDSKPAADEPWRSVRSWEKAWSQAEYNRIRPDLIRRRRYGNLVLATPEQDEDPQPA
jgi:hypothetical protein